MCKGCIDQVFKARVTASYRAGYRVMGRPAFQELRALAYFSAFCRALNSGPPDTPRKLDTQSLEEIWAP